MTEPADSVPPSDTHDRANLFLSLHVPGRPLLMPNPWDAGTARLLCSLGYRALATTSSGHAATLGRPDGSVSRDEALSHAASLVAAVDVPVSADLEDGYAADPESVHSTVLAAAGTGLAGCSIEDFASGPEPRLYEAGHAADRVAAAAQAAHAGPGLVLTARAENFIRGNPDLDDTITRLQAYQEAGADVLYAPGLTGIDDIRRVVSAVDRPVNVLTTPGTPTVSELADAGVARISVGGAFSTVARSAVVEAARELLEEGTYSYLEAPTGEYRDSAASAIAEG